MFWRRSSRRLVPVEVGEVLVSRFHLGPQDIGRMLCLGKNTRFGGRPVRAIRLYDLALIPNGGRASRSYEGLARQRKAVLFEGHIEKDGSVVLVDRRPLRASPVYRHVLPPGMTAHYQS